MKRQVLYLSVAVILLASLTLVAGDEKPWCDMKNCDFCNYLMEDPGLLDNMTWDHYDISNGVMSVTTVKPGFGESYRKAQKAMQALGEEMTAGKTDVKMCGMCENYGKLMVLGAKFEAVNADVGDIVLCTSDNPEVVKAIQEHGQRTREEMAKMEDAEKE